MGERHAKAAGRDRARHRLDDRGLGLERCRCATPLAMAIAPVRLRNVLRLRILLASDDISSLRRPTPVGPRGRRPVCTARGRAVRLQAGTRVRTRRACQPRRHGHAPPARRPRERGTPGALGASRAGRDGRRPGLAHAEHHRQHPRRTVDGRVGRRQWHHGQRDAAAPASRPVGHRAGLGLPLGRPARRAPLGDRRAAGDLDRRAAGQSGLSPH